MNKTCSKCGVNKNRIAEFYVRGNICRECRKEYDKVNRKRIRVREVKRKYGLSLEDVEQLFSDQNSCCKICFIRFSDTRDTQYNVDHCHKTGEVRGLLCRHCNVGLGNFKDNPDTLKRAIEYLEKTNEVSNPK